MRAGVPTVPAHSRFARGGWRLTGRVLCARQIGSLSRLLVLGACQLGDRVLLRITESTTPAKQSGAPPVGYAAAVAATTSLTLVGLYLILSEVVDLVRVAIGT